MKFLNRFGRKEKEPERNQAEKFTGIAAITAKVTRAYSEDSPQETIFSFPSTNCKLELKVLAVEEISRTEDSPNLDIKIGDTLNGYIPDGPRIDAGEKVRFSHFWINGQPDNAAQYEILDDNGGVLYGARGFYLSLSKNAVRN